MGTLLCVSGAALLLVSVIVVWAACMLSSCLSQKGL
jgi:hypothetical protein